MADTLNIANLPDPLDMNFNPEGLNLNGVNNIPEHGYQAIPVKHSKVINYLWVGKTPFSPQKGNKTRYGIPANLLETIRQCAERFPDNTEIRLWVDSRYLDQESIAETQRILSQFGNYITLCDLNQNCERLLNSKILLNDTSPLPEREYQSALNMSDRIDLFKLLIIEQSIKDGAQTAAISDLDIRTNLFEIADDVFKKLQQLGFIAGKPNELGLQGWVENQFFAIDTQNDGIRIGNRERTVEGDVVTGYAPLEFISAMIDYITEDGKTARNIYGIFANAIIYLDGRTGNPERYIYKGLGHGCGKEMLPVNEYPGFIDTHRIVNAPNPANAL